MFFVFVLFVIALCIIAYYINVSHSVDILKT